MKNCPKCNSTHLKDGIFCSRSCANSRQFTIEARLKKSIANKGQIPWNKGRVKFFNLTCVNCKTSFVAKKKRDYCTRKCNPNIGGYREGSGRAKTGRYKGIYCGSTWELVWVIYQLDNNIPFTRFPSVLKKDGLTYVPDFLQDGKIIEIKGYENLESVNKKTKLANELGYEVIIARKDDLKHCFDWVKENYKYNCITELYDSSYQSSGLGHHNLTVET